MRAERPDARGGRCLGGREEERAEGRGRERALRAGPAGRERAVRVGGGGGGGEGGGRGRGGRGGPGVGGGALGVGRGELAGVRRVGGPRVREPGVLRELPELRGRGLLECRVWGCRHRSGSREARWAA